MYIFSHTEGEIESSYNNNINKKKICKKILPYCVGYGRFNLRLVR
jgi:hypothetical protein